MSHPRIVHALAALLLVVSYAGAARAGDAGSGAFSSPPSFRQDVQPPCAINLSTAVAAELCRQR